MNMVASYHRAVSRPHEYTDMSPPGSRFSFPVHCPSKALRSSC